VTAPTQTVAFPGHFRWGAATAAFQVEGSTAADGRSDSIWDVFCRRPGAVANGDTGDPACDHYRRMPDDVALMADLGLGTYRFSVAWPRVRPGGGPVNRAGLDFYSRLVDALLDKGIRPWLTLYHWDLPQSLEDAGGWTHRDTAHRFVEYAESVADVLGDRVPTWTTLNEPWCSSLLGYAEGQHAPGRTEPRAAVAAIHHLLLAHGLGVQALRARLPEVDLGLTLNLAPVTPAAPERPEDVEVARRVDGLQNRVFLDPVLRGRYPADVWEDLAPFGLGDHVREGDLDAIGERIDVLGVNYYTSAHVAAGDPGRESRPSPWVGAGPVQEVRRGLPVTAMGWEVDPGGLTRLLVRLHQEYPGTPLMITENGAAYPDAVDGDRAVRDDDRLAYLHAHLAAAHEAIERGVDLRGYFAWSLLDNFEWAHGYGKRFGLVHVDYATQRRTPKASARWYADVARSSRLTPP
jgi:beta-glucosidase